MNLTQFPPANYIPTESAVEGIDVYMPAPVQPETQDEVVEFNCPQCKAATAYSASDGGLTCTHCGYYEPPRKEAVGKRAEGFEFTVKTLARAAHGWGEARKELQCQNCGAYTTIALDSLTHTCPFCSSNKVIQHQASQDALRPRFLIPFKLETSACHQITRKWLGDSWMVPRSLRRVAQVATFTGIYIPFWAFDAATSASWKAQVGHTKTERYYSNGKWRTRRKTVWKWESGHVRLDNKNVLIPGTERLSQLLLGQIDGYNLHDLAPYEPTYLAGFQAQAYDVLLETAWESSRHQMRERTRQACRQQASTNKIRHFQMTLDFEQEAWRYILLPLYIAVYHYRETPYQVMINGQTGAIAGQRPVDWAKVWLAVAALVAPGLTIGLVGLLTLVFGGLGLPIALVGFVLLIIGAVVGLNFVTKASRMDDA